MTDPTPGKFASRDDVTGRFEGVIPSGRLAWVDVQIGVVERELMFWVPSLRKSLGDITADSVAAGDPDRPTRVVDVVCEKVLDIYRNPGGAKTQHSTTTPDVTVSNAWSADPTRGKVQFSDEQLAKCRLHTKRQRFGSIQIDPGLIAGDRRRCY